jgi:hypothetical protein
VQTKFKVNQKNLISKENNHKFDQILKNGFKIGKGTDIYPVFVQSDLEKNVKLTLKFRWKIQKQS